MFTEQKLLFIYTVSPLHMGAGTAVGVVDNPIQREVHTGWPSMAGSGIKGAIRHGLRDSWSAEDLKSIFGPEPREAKLHAGAVSFTDAQIVCFPVRSLKRAYGYVTCPTAVARLRRFGDVPPLPDIGEGEALVSGNDILDGNKLVLEALAYGAKVSSEAAAVASWLAERALPPGFFADKMRKDLIVLSDVDFTYFVRNSTLVEPHVRISDETGAAEGRGLFYTENLPPETLLASVLLASVVRDGKREMSASQVVSKVSGSLGSGKPWQFGGDATTGRGLAFLRVV